MVLQYKSGTSTSCDFGAVPLLMHPRNALALLAAIAHFWLILKWLTPRSLLLGAQQVRECYRVYKIFYSVVGFLRREGCGSDLWEHIVTFAASFPIEFAYEKLVRNVANGNLVTVACCQVLIPPECPECNPMTVGMLPQLKLCGLVVSPPHLVLSYF